MIPALNLQATASHLSIRSNNDCVLFNARGHVKTDSLTGTPILGYTFSIGNE